MTHQVDYKGYTIYCENGLYYVGAAPQNKYFTFQTAKEEVDKLDTKENYIDLKKVKQ